MFWLLRFSLKWIIRIKILVLAVLAGMGIAYGLQLKRQYDTWGLVEGDADKALNGDEYVPEAEFDETRSITIYARPDEVWPWLVQLGYGRAGWYSFEQLDRPWSPTGGPMGESADEILSEFQDLAVGDLVPTHAEGGFDAKVVDENEALVLFLDDVMTREQVEELVADADDEEVAEAVGDMEMPPFRVSWAFILEPMSRDRTRLIERLRVGVEGMNDQQRKGMPLMKAGVFALMRSQMLGIKERVEAAAEDEEVAA